MSRATRMKFGGGMALRFLTGAVVGGLAAAIGIDLFGDRDLSGFHAAGMAVALLLALIGGACLAGSLTARGAARLLAIGVEPGEDFTAERRSLRWQGVVSVLAGLELVVLSLRPEFLAGPYRLLFLLLLAGGLVVRTAFNLMIWRRGDEYFRRVLLDAAVFAFVAFQFLLFLAAAGARFGYIADPDALDIYVALMAVYLIASGVAAGRRGYGVPAGEA